MFTGLIETIGAVASVEKTGNGIRLLLRPLTDFEVGLGDSISINGVCLTVTKHNKGVSQHVTSKSELALTYLQRQCEAQTLGS